MRSDYNAEVLNKIVFEDSISQEEYEYIDAFIIKLEQDQDVGMVIHVKTNSKDFHQEKVMNKIGAYLRKKKFDASRITMQVDRLESDKEIKKALIKIVY